MVERNLAKVEVAGPSPVFRSEVLFEGPFFVEQECSPGAVGAVVRHGMGTACTANRSAAKISMLR